MNFILNSYFSNSTLGKLCFCFCTTHDRYQTWGFINKFCKQKFTAQFKIAFFNW